MQPCVICGSVAEFGSNSAMRQFNCDRCGPFEISGTAVAVLKARTHNSDGAVNELVVAKVSHYIRTHSIPQKWLSIQSDLIDEMVSQKLPAPTRQLETLLTWMAEQAGEDHFRVLEFSGTDVASIIGAASTDAAHDLIEDAQQSGLIEFVPDDCYKLTRLAWDHLASAAPAQKPRRDEGGFIDTERLAQLAVIGRGQFDLTRLKRMCEEIDDAWRSGNTISVAMLARAIVDHIPPIFGEVSFGHVASHMPRSIKGSFLHIDDSLRHIADGALHTHIRSRETLPSPTQVDFRQSFDVLLGEIIRKLS